MKSQGKYIELESLRGIAALLVVFFHIPNFNPILNMNFFHNLDLMVDLFFVLSGFVIYSAYADRIQTKAELFKFQFLRFGRLYPIHIIFLVIFLAFEVARYILNATGHSFSQSQPFDKNDFAALIEHLFLIQSFTGNALTFNIVAWSISVEFYTYILFGLIVLYFRYLKDYLFFLIAIISICLLFYGVGIDLSRVLRGTAGFFLGCLTAKLIKENSHNCPGLVSLLTFALLIAFVSLNTSNVYDPFIYFLSATLIYSLVSNPVGKLNLVLQNRFLVYLGTISYSMYMSHVSVLFIANYIVKLYKAPSFLSKDGQMIPYLNSIELTVYIALSLVLVIAISHILYNFIEQPFRSRSRELSTKLKLMN